MPRWLNKEGLEEVDYDVTQCRGFQDVDKRINSSDRTLPAQCADCNVVFNFKTHGKRGNGAIMPEGSPGCIRVNQRANFLRRQLKRKFNPHRFEQQQELIEMESKESFYFGPTE